MDSSPGMSMLDCEINRCARGSSREDETGCSCKGRVPRAARSYGVMPYMHSGRVASAMLRGMLAEAVE